AADAAWPGSNGAIFFVELAADEEGLDRSPDGIWRRAPGERRPRVQLTADSSDGEPTVSPNGQWIAFSRVIPAGETQPTVGRAIFMMRTDGSGVSQLTDGRHGDSAPAFTRSGRRILFTRSPRVEAPRASIYSVRTDGTGLRRLTSGHEPTFSPRGNLVAFIRGAHVHTMRPDGSRIRDLTPRLGKAANEPDFSPSGRAIAFAASEESESHIYTVRLRDGKISQLTRTPDRCGRCELYSDPAYAPDGRALIATATDYFHFRMETVRFTRPPLTELGHFGALKEPVWQPRPGSR
ncbi:MAG TPA: hypothetical protein VHF50_01940, partial [Solirubrobacterales bacterium]|nr:hypothetical protein [Solirubrobacterales bacterium]